MITGPPMQLEATLNLLCDLAAEIVSYERALVFLWDESRERMQANILRGFTTDFQARPEALAANVLCLSALKYSRPLLVSRGKDPHVDVLLDTAAAESSLTIPLLVSGKVRGSLQLYSGTAGAFTAEDAQLLWVFSLVAEPLLTREYSSESLVRFAFTDYLTGIGTRGYFEQQLDLEVKRAERGRQKFAILMIDIDHFKRLNDTYGHHAGDEVLREVANILVEDMREVDTVARYGGEEFVIILPETTEAGALHVAERLRHSVEQATFLAGSAHPIQHLTISLGVAVYDSDARVKRDLIKFSDIALYAAKHEGRNRIMNYSQLAEREQKRAS